MNSTKMRTALSILTAVIIVSQIIQSVLSVNVTDQQNTLRVVAVLFRHGARTPAQPGYTSDPYRNYQWPEGYAGLTNHGKQIMFELGKKYRRQYAGFLPDFYSDDDIYIRSSDASRCLMSAELVLAGLYPPTGKQIWNENLDWQPIPVHSLPRDIDDMVAATKPCKLKDTMYKEIFDSHANDSVFADYYDYLTLHTNDTIDGVFSFSSLYDTLLCEQQYGLALPEWTKEVFPEKMVPGIRTCFYLVAYNSVVQKLTIGNMLGEIKKNFELKIDGEVVRKMFLYSAHDMNVINLWRALGFEEFIIPAYGAGIILELHENSPNEYFVKALYRNDTFIEQPHELLMPFCDNPCPFNMFSQYITKLIPQLDWDIECMNTPGY